MKKTANLELPIYDNPETDVFDLEDWNIANQNLDNAFSALVEGGTLDIINSEVIDARKGKVDLKTKIDEIDTNISNKIEKTSIVNNLTSGGTEKVLSAEQGKIINEQLEQINNIIKEFKYNVYDKKSFIVDSDITKIKYMINNNLPCKIAILGDSNEAGVGYKFSGGSHGYAEMGDIQKPTHHEMYCIYLLLNSPFFIKPSPELGGAESFFPKGAKIEGIGDSSNMINWDRYFMTYGLQRYPTTEITLNFKHLLSNRKNKMYVIYGQRNANGAATFDVVSNGEIKYCHTYKNDKTYGSGENTTIVPQEGFSLYWREINIPTDTNEFEVKINNVRQGLGNTSTTGNINIVGFYYGDIFEFRNFSVRTTTLEDNSNANKSKSITTSGRIQQALLYGANVFFMGWGTNDANISNYPLQDFLTEYLRRYNNLKISDPNCVVILNNDAEDRKNVEYYDALKKMCIDNNISFLDFRSVLNNYPRNEVMYDNYSHINEKGTRVLSEYLSKLL
jgi:hypothetical protein